MTLVSHRVVPMSSSLPSYWFSLQTKRPFWISQVLSKLLESKKCRKKAWNLLKKKVIRLGIRGNLLLRNRFQDWWIRRITGGWGQKLLMRCYMRSGIELILIGNICWRIQKESLSFWFSYWVTKISKLFWILWICSI